MRRWEMGGELRLRGWGDGDGGFELAASEAVAHGGECGQEHEGGEEDEYAFRGGASGVGGVEEHEMWRIMSKGGGDVEEWAS